MDKKKMILYINKLKSWLVYAGKFIVYIAKLVFWKIKKLVIKYPRFAAIAGGAVLVLVAATLSAPTIIKFIRAPRPLPLTTAPKESGFAFAASDKRTKFSAYIGESGSNIPKVQATFPGGTSVDFVLTDLNQTLSKPSKSGNKVLFKDVRTNVDLSYETLTNGIKEDIIIKKPTEGNAFTFTLNNFGAAPKKIAPQTYGSVFYDANGAYVFHFAKPFAVDAKGARTDNVLISIHKADKDPSYSTTVIVNTKWLSDPARVYPITIDPTVVYSTSSQFAAGQFNRVVDTGSGASPNLTTNYQELTSDINTVGLWHMNEASGTTTVSDSSGNGNTGTSASSTNVTTGQLGNARSFNGSSDYMTTPASTIYTPSSGTIELWTYLNSQLTVDNTYYTFLSTGPAAETSGWKFEYYLISGTYYLSFRKWTPQVYGQIAYTLPINTWVHLSATWNGTTTYLYVNGVQIGSVDQASPTSASLTMYIGRDSRVSGSFLNGYLDEIRISNVARTPEEIELDAQRRPYSTYTSDVMDLGTTSAWNSLSWTELGVNTGDGETPYSTTGLVAQWNFNNTSNTTTLTNDAGSCGSSCNGTLTNFGTGSTGQDILVASGWTAANKRWGAGALMFKGDNDFVNIPDTNALSFTNKVFSFEAWFKSSGNGTNQTIISKGAASNWEYEFRINGANVMFFALHNAAGTTGTFATGTTVVTDGQWHHVVATGDGTTLTIYLDGKFQTSKTFSADAETNGTSPLAIGARVSAAYPFNGIIDSTRIYSRALTASEILSNYQAGNMELQTRVGTTTDANDGTWEAWMPTTGETAIASMDTDAANWTWDSTATYMPQVKSGESNIKMEGSGSLKQIIGQPQADANTVGLWHLDETGGTGAYLKDSTANANNGTPTNTTIVNGFSGKARSFNGSSDLITVNDSSSLDLTTTGSIEAWIKTSTNKANNWFLCKNGNYCLGVDATGGFLFTGASAQDNAGTSLLAGTWHHVAVTNNNTTVTYYVDGAAAGTDAVAWGSTLTNALTIGRDGGTNYFSGTIDEIRISNSVRSAEEIAEAYRAGRDHYLNRTISANLSTSTTLPFYVASDRQGTFLNATIGESAYANYQPDANTVGLWHLDDYRYKDSSGNNNDGITSYYGIDYGIASSNLTLIADQWNGAANNGEMDITCTGGDAACAIVTMNGATISTPSINYGVAMIETTTVAAYIMYSPSLAGQGITTCANGSDNYISVKYTGSVWQYDNNSTWVTFTPNSSNILIASLTEGTTITNLKQLNFHPILTQGKIGKARSFSSNYISLENKSIVDGLANLTVDAWVYPTDIAAAHYRVFTETNVLYVGQYGGQASFYMGNGTAWSVSDITGGTLPANQWSHLAWVKSGTNYYVYINGLLTKSGATAPATLGTSSNINYLSYSGQFWFGSLDEVRISNVARTADQIRQAYEVGARTHNITIDFKAALDSGNLIANTSDLSFTIDATAFGASSMGSNLYLGDKIIVKENYDGTEYIAQGTVNAINVSTGAVTVAAWDNGSTAPSGGFTASATVFKWQREYFDVRGSRCTASNDANCDRYAVTNLTLRETDGSQGANVWLDDFRSSGGYLTAPGGDTITSSTGDQYFQYRIIESSFDTNVSTSVTSATIDYVQNVPAAPTIGTPTAISNSSIQWNFTGNGAGASSIIGFKVYDGSNTLMATCLGASITSCTETGLSTNTQYTRKVVAYNSYGNSGYSATAAKYTLAVVPGMPATSSPTATTIGVNPDQGTNPSSTQLALYIETGTTCDGSGGNYIAANGSSSGTAVWQTDAQWATVTATGLNLEANRYIFCVKARNGDTVETAFSAGESSNGGWFPLCGNFTVTKNMTLANKYVDGNDAARWVAGLDSCSGTANTSVLTLESGVLTINAGDTVVAGSFVFAEGSESSIAMPLGVTTGQLKPAVPLWVVDADNDNYPSAIKVYFGATPTGGKRVRDIPSLAVAADCNDGSSTVWLSHAQCYADMDKDTYTAGLAANSTCLNAASCNSATAGSASTNGAAVTAYTAGQLKNSQHLNSLGANDCDDTDAAKWVIGVYGCGQ